MLFSFPPLSTVPPLRQPGKAKTIVTLVHSLSSWTLEFSGLTTYTKGIEVRAHSLGLDRRLTCMVDEQQALQQLSLRELMPRAEKLLPNGLRVQIGGYKHHSQARLLLGHLCLQ